MDRTEIIERLKNIAEHAVHTVGERPFIMSLDDGIAVHEAIELLKKAETNCPEIPDSWIPVTERMPESADCPMDCLVTRKSKTIGNYTDMAVAEKGGTWTHEDWEAIVLGDNVSGKKTGLLNTRGDEIVAWMPLPEPYMEGEQRETD